MTDGKAGTLYYKQYYCIMTIDEITVCKIICLHNGVKVTVL